MPKFKCIPKLQEEQEACFMFIDKGAFLGRKVSRSEIS